MGKLVGNYRYQAQVTAPSTSTVTMTGYPVPTGCIAMITYMAIMDYTTNANEALLGIRDKGGNDHYLHKELGTATDIKHGAKMEGEIILLPGEKPLGVILSPSTSDVCYFTAHGGLYEQEGQ